MVFTPKRFTLKAQEPLFPNVTVCCHVTVCVQMAAAMEVAILPVQPGAKLRSGCETTDV